ncbi:hypothetical protein [Streptomyces sp. ST2-7A]|nr:hypothetical protein [Streptomyces sp. ST2-7A]
MGLFRRHRCVWDDVHTPGSTQPTGLQQCHHCHSTRTKPRQEARR